MHEWYSLTLEEIEKKLRTSKEKGINSIEIKQRQRIYGKNILKKTKKRSVLLKFIDQFKDFMILILIISAIISFFMGETTDAIIIFIIIMFNAIIGVAQEGKAEKSLESLQKLSTPKCKVIRNGKYEVVSSDDIVVGDLVILETGDLVPADLRLSKCINLSLQESSFTGETTAVSKNTAIIHKNNLVIADIKNMAFSSSLVTYGRGEGIVVSTGMNTQIGKIANFIQNDGSKTSPLKQRLDSLGKFLGLAALIICFVIFLMGLFIYKMDVFDIFLVSISLAVAAIPEGLPAVATIVLAIGVQKMAKKKAIIRKLQSVETLGSTTVICTDKTGTLTQNKMTVKQIYANNILDEFNKKIKINNTISKLITCSVLCNDSKIKRNMIGIEILGDPTETALVDMAQIIKINKEKLDTEFPRVHEIPFDSNRKCMSTVHECNGKYMIYLKGGLDEVLEKCEYVLIGSELKKLDNYVVDKIKQSNLKMTSQALRVLSFAYKEMDTLKTNKNDIESHLVFLGFVGMIDPPRPEVKEAIKKCRESGIKTIMITGDHKDTAIAIAKDLGILKSENEAILGHKLDSISDSQFAKDVNKYTVYARVSPEHKVKIVKALKANGEIVAMTGDGINDAPALKSADIGVAMGNIGTEVAKEASDMVLANDNFATIVDAVEEGRRIFDNIQKAIKFLLSCNIGEILTIFLAMLFGLKEPFLPIHILWINLISDSFPALALGVDKAEENIMKRKPNKNSKSMFDFKVTLALAYQGLTIAIATLVAFLIGLNVDRSTAQTMAFCVLGFSQLTHAFNIHINHKSIFSFKTLSNNYLNLATILSAGLMFVVLLIPVIRDIFKFAVLSSQNVLIVIILSFAPVILQEILKRFKLD